jgi:hypothetical protein
MGALDRGVGAPDQRQAPRKGQYAPVRSAPSASARSTYAEEAEAREAKVRIDIGKGVHVAPHDSITVAEAAANWIKRAEAEGWSGPPPGRTGPTSICTSCRSWGGSNWRN